MAKADCAAVIFLEFKSKIQASQNVFSGRLKDIQLTFRNNPVELWYFCKLCPKGKKSLAPNHLSSFSESLKLSDIGHIYFPT